MSDRDAARDSGQVQEGVTLNPGREHPSPAPSAASASRWSADLVAERWEAFTPAAEILVELLCAHSNALWHMSYTGDQPDMGEKQVDVLRKLLNEAARFIHANYDVLVK